VCEQCRCVPEEGFADFWRRSVRSVDKVVFFMQWCLSMAMNSGLMFVLLSFRVSKLQKSCYRKCASSSFACSSGLCFLALYKYCWRSCLVNAARFVQSSQALQDQVFTMPAYLLQISGHFVLHVWHGWKHHEWVVWTTGECRFVWFFLLPPLKGIYKNCSFCWLCYNWFLTESVEKHCPDIMQSYFHVLSWMTAYICLC